MARCARYGAVQPSEFDDLGYHDTFRLVRRLTELYDQEMNVHVEIAMARMKAGV